MVTFAKINLIRRLLTLFVPILLHILLILPHVVPAFFGHGLLIFPLFWGAGPALAPFPHADPISLRSQAITRFHIRHRYNEGKGKVLTILINYVCFRQKR